MTLSASARWKAVPLLVLSGLAATAALALVVVFVAAASHVRSATTGSLSPGFWVLLLVLGPPFALSVAVAFLSGLSAQAVRTGLAARDRRRRLAIIALVQAALGVVLVLLPFAWGDVDADFLVRPTEAVGLVSLSAAIYGTFLSLSARRSSPDGSTLRT